MLKRPPGIQTMPSGAGPGGGVLLIAGPAGDVPACPSLWADVAGAAAGGD